MNKTIIFLHVVFYNQVRFQSYLIPHFHMLILIHQSVFFVFKIRIIQVFTKITWCITFTYTRILYKPIITSMIELDLYQSILCIHICIYHCSNAGYHYKHLHLIYIYITVGLTIHSWLLIEHISMRSLHSLYYNQLILQILSDLYYSFSLNIVNV